MNTNTAEVIENAMPIMSLRHVHQYFGGVQALIDVDMDIYPGEVIALVGDNGAGKSTFLKVISGVNIPQQSEIEFEGETITISNTLDPVNLGIQTVYQDLALCDNLDVVQNLFLGREIVNKFGRLNESEMERIARECLDEMGIELTSVRAKVSDLSGGQRQAVAIARAMLGSPKIVLLDEPLANLGLVQREQVGKLILNLRSKNVGVVVVSHDLAEVFAVCDRVVVFRLGEKVAEISRPEITKERVVAEITGSNTFMEEDE